MGLSLAMDGRLESLLRRHDPALADKEVFRKKYGCKRKEWTQSVKDEGKVLKDAWRVGLMARYYELEASSSPATVAGRLGSGRI